MKHPRSQGFYWLRPKDGRQPSDIGFCEFVDDNPRDVRWILWSDKTWPGYVCWNDLKMYYRAIEPLATPSWERSDP